LYIVQAIILIFFRIKLIFSVRIIGHSILQAQLFFALDTIF